MIQEFSSSIYDLRWHLISNCETRSYDNSNSTGRQH